MFLVSLFLFYGVVMMGAKNFSTANFSRYKNLLWKNFFALWGISVIQLYSKGTFRHK